MTVRDLIEKLQTYPQDKQVWFTNDVLEAHSRRMYAKDIYQDEVGAVMFKYDKDR